MWPIALMPNTTTKFDASKTTRSLFWSGGSYALTAVLNLGMIALLVKWLTPSEMALIFIAIPFQDLATLFMDNGMGSYVVQHEKLSLEELSSCFWQGAITGILFAALMILSAPWLTVFFRSPPLATALQVTALSFIPIALAFPQKSLLQKHMHFKRIALAEFLGMLAAVVVTLVMIKQGHGFISYLYGFLARKTLELILIWAKEPWLPQFSLHREQMGKLLVFGSYASGGVMSAYAVRLVDTFIIGRVLGVHALGLYSLASNLVFFPVSKCVATFARVFIATFSHLKSEGEAALRQAFNKVLKNLLLLLMPALLLLGLCIEWGLSVFNPTWLSTASVVRILIFYGFLVIVLRLGEPLLLALNKAKSVFWINGIAIVLTTVLLLWMTPYGLESAAWAVVLGSIIPVGMMLRKLNTLIGLTWGEFVHVKKSG